MYEVEEHIPIIVSLDHSDFDEAIKQAYKMAMYEFGVCKSGHFNNVSIAERSTHSLHVEFNKCEMSGSMSGTCYDYEYSAWVE